LSPISELLRAEDDRLPGPTPSYGKAHLLLSILSIGDAKLIGRHALAKEVGIGEGAVRTIIKKLKQAGYLTTTASGCTLTSRGERLFLETKALLPHVLSIPHTDLTVGNEQTAVLVRGAASRVGDGIEQRDEAVKAGADGATTFVILDSKFRIPRASQDCESDYPGRVWALLREKLRPGNGDVMIISGAGTTDLSKVGAISAALTLIGK
jgi:predicted transcriptional regulator